MANLDNLIVSARRALAGCPDTGPKRSINRKHLSFLILQRHKRTGAMSDLDEAISLAREAVADVPIEIRPATKREDALVQRRAAYLKFLGGLIGQRYEISGDAGNLEEAVLLARQAVDDVAAADRYRPIYLGSLATILRVKYGLTQALDDLNESIETGKQALGSAYENDADRAGMLHSHAISLRLHYSRTGRLSDLEEAISSLRQALAISPDDMQEHEWLNSLGICLHNRYLRTGDLHDLNESLRATKQAANLAYDGLEKAMYLSNLSTQHVSRHVRTGDVVELDEAIQATRAALEMTPQSGPTQAALWGNLGVYFTDRFLCTKAIADVDQAIRAIKQSLAATPYEDSRRGPRLNNLGNALSEKYWRTGALQDLEEAIQTTQEAIEATPSGCPDQTMCRSNLGNMLRKKYMATGDLAVLDEAVQLAKQTVQDMPIDHPDRSLCLNSVAGALNERYKATGGRQDLQEAIDLVEQALQITPHNHPDRAAWLSNLALYLEQRHSYTGLAQDRATAIELLQTALCQENSSTLFRIEAGANLMRLCSDWQQAYKAAALAVSLVPALTLRSLANPDKQHVLSQVVGLASDAAAIALRAGKEPLDALRLLEQGRGVLAASVDDLRSDSLGLKEGHPELAEKFRHLQQELDTPAVLDGRSLDVNPDTYVPSSQSRRYDAGKELDQLIEAIRKLPGFQGFPQAPELLDLTAAASCGPIVVINNSQYQCDAFLIEHHQIGVLALPRLTKGSIQAMWEQGNPESQRVLEWLWDAVAGPVLDALGFHGPPGDGKWPHVWWILTGTLSRLPIHAAGYHTKMSSETVIDRVISSYSSSIRALIRARQRPTTNSVPANVLLVAMQDTPHHARLPYAFEEVQEVHVACESMGMVPVQSGRQKRQLMMHLPNCTIFHFAGHGYTDDHDPSQSYLCLEDYMENPLKVADFLELNLQESAPFLAYLSACGTGRVEDEKFADESIHLVGACQLAGFRHVIGTLWEVNDRQCLDIARITYDSLRDGLTDKSIARGLHKATLELRDRWLQTWLRSTHQYNSAGSEFGRPQKRPWTPADQDLKSETLARKAKLYQPSGGVDKIYRQSPNWVPYIHFGV